MMFTLYSVIRDQDAQIVLLLQIAAVSAERDTLRIVAMQLNISKNYTILALLTTPSTKAALLRRDEDIFRALQKMTKMKQGNNVFLICIRPMTIIINSIVT